MKTFRKSEARNSGALTPRFFHSRPLNTLTVENRRTGVVITARRDNFSEEDKIFFIQYLVEEGFIPDRYRAYGEPGESIRLTLDWIVEENCRPEWPEAPLHYPRTNRFMIRLLGCASILWATELAGLLLTGH